MTTEQRAPQDNSNPAEASTDSTTTSSSQFESMPSVDDQGGHSDVQNSQPEPDEPGAKLSSEQSTPSAVETNVHENESSSSESSVSTPDSAASSPPPTASSENSEPESLATQRKKFALNPVATPEQVRPVPSIGAETGVVQPVSDTPVELPGSSDQEVEAEVVKAISNLGSDQQAAETNQQSASDPVTIPDKSAIDASIEAAIEEAMLGSPASSSTEEAQTASIDIEELQPGQPLKGVVQSVANDFVFVDFGLRLSGAVSIRNFGNLPMPQAGETIDVIFDQVDENEGLILARLPGRASTVTSSGDWELLSKGQMVECLVKKTNKGGLEVTVGSLRGFIPASQIDFGFVEEMETYVGRKLTAIVTELKPEKKNLVLSRRKVLKIRRDEQKKDLMSELKNDQVRTGTVKTIKDYGAFVDLGGVDGFLPISQISWIRIEHPSEVISEGQEIEVKVLGVDHEKEKISLGMRQLTQNPWRAAESKYEKGSAVTGRVTRVEPFGAFVELEPGIEGLVHISELEHRRVKRVTEVLNVGDMADVQVLEVDPAKKRISLSVKALLAKPEPIDRVKEEETAVEKYERKRKGPLKGGTGASEGGGLFGNPKDFGR